MAGPGGAAAALPRTCSGRSEPGTRAGRPSPDPSPDPSPGSRREGGRAARAKKAGGTRSEGPGPRASFPRAGGWAPSAGQVSPEGCPPARLRPGDHTEPNLSGANRPPVAVNQLLVQEAECGPALRELSRPGEGLLGWHCVPGARHRVKFSALEHRAHASRGEGYSLLEHPDAIL